LLLRGAEVMQVLAETLSRDERRERAIHRGLLIGHLGGEVHLIEQRAVEGIGRERRDARTPEGHPCNAHAALEHPRGAIDAGLEASASAEVLERFERAVGMPAAIGAQHVANVATALQEIEVRLELSR